MDLREFFQNENVIRGGLNLAKIAPRWAGYGLAERVGREIADKKPAVYWQVRENIAIITGLQDDDEQLAKITQQAFVNAGRYYYDFYNIIGKPPKVVREKIAIPNEFFDMLTQAKKEGRGVQLAGIHLSNFDLGAMALASHGYQIQALSAANPSKGYKLQNRLRKDYGFMATPINPASLRQAVRRLKDDKIVATGLDWPHPEEENLTEVFGKPAYVPLGTSRLSLITDCLTIIVAFYADPDSDCGYGMYASDPIDVIRTGDREEEIKLNTRRYMEFFEQVVGKHPDQWMMFRQFWAVDDNGQVKEN
jgi:lauroyl/myristoyl acyltransferase